MFCVGGLKTRTSPKVALEASNSGLSCMLGVCTCIGTDCQVNPNDLHVTRFEYGWMVKFMQKTPMLLLKNRRKIEKKIKFI